MERLEKLPEGAKEENEMGREEGKTAGEGSGQVGEMKTQKEQGEDEENGLGGEIRELPGG